MNKKLIIILVFFFLLLTSCKAKLEYYQKDNMGSFIEKLYETVNEEGNKYACFDLRSHDIYIKEHLKYAENYDLNNNSIESFHKYLLDNYNKNYDIYLISEEELDLTNLKEFNIKCLITTYQEFKEKAESYFIFDSGEYDCGC